MFVIGIIMVTIFYLQNNLIYQADVMPTEVVFNTSHTEITLHTIASGIKEEHEAQNICIQYFKNGHWLH